VRKKKRKKETSSETNLIERSETPTAGSGSKALALNDQRRRQPVAGLRERSKKIRRRGEMGLGFFPLGLGEAPREKKSREK
jgi:hypothetical protein